MAADDWLAAYAVMPILLFGPALFTVGHALELYLKAAVAKQTGAAPRVHDIGRLWNDVKAKDSGFLPNHAINPVHLAEFQQGKRVKELVHEGRSNHEILSFQEHIELFAVITALVDLKYLQLPSSRLRTHGLMVMRPNPYWSALFRDLRRWLVWPEQGSNDFLQLHITESEMPNQGREFLKAVIETAG